MKAQVSLEAIIVVLILIAAVFAVVSAFYPPTDAQTFDRILDSATSHNVGGFSKYTNNLSGFGEVPI